MLIYYFDKSSCLLDSQNCTLWVNEVEWNSFLTITEYYLMTMKTGGIDTNVPKLSKAKAGDLLRNFDWTAEQSPKHGDKLEVTLRFKLWPLGWLPSNQYN